jgi:glycosyltransferase involved in cell wall biosynthesis
LNEINGAIEQIKSSIFIPFTQEILMDKQHSGTQIGANGDKKSSPMIVHKLSIVIPAYNEGPTIHHILNKVKAVELINNIDKEVIIVNDCSRDNTEEAIYAYMNANPDLNIQYYKHEVNKGKGAALHTGIAKATGEFTVIQDADLEYDPAEFNLLLKPVIEGQADVVYGSRFMGGNPHRILFFWHSIGNKFLTFLSNMFTNLNLTDMETCYKLFDTKVLQSLKLKENRFGFEPEVTAKIARVPRIRIYEVGISYYGRTFEEGKKIGWRDGFRAIYCILKYNFFAQKQKEVETYAERVARESLASKNI